jgi:hypothetical protein
MSEPDDPLLRQPILVIGSPRSGTTLLAEVLQHHPDLAYVEEPRLTWRLGNDRKSDMLRPRDARPPVKARIRRAFAELVRKAGRTRLLEKTPSNALRLGFVDEIFPDARYVHIIRNGLDSVLSIRKYWEDHAGGLRAVKLGQRAREIRWRQAPHYAVELARRVAPAGLAPVLGYRVWGPRLPGMNGLLRDLDLVEVCCLQWRMCVEAAAHYGRQLPASRYLEIRLEDMSPDHLQKIMSFCDLTHDSTVIAEFNQRFDPSLAGARKAEADPAELDQIMPWIEPTMRWLGYL